MSFYLLSLLSFLRMIAVFSVKGYTSLVKFTFKYFVLFDVIVNTFS